MQYSHLEGINIGSGQHYADGWLNTDIIPTDTGRQPDILADIFDFPLLFERHEFKKAYVGHVLEHIRLTDLKRALDCIAYIADEIMVVGPCLQKAAATGQPQWLLDGIIAPDEIDQHPWSHKWTPTEDLTFDLIEAAGYKPTIVDVGRVTFPEWPNPSVAPWQTAMRFSG